MGCHTWFLKKIDPQPTHGEVVAQVLRQYKYELYLDEQAIGGNPKYSWLLDANYGCQYLSSCIVEIKQLISEIENNIADWDMVYENYYHPIEQKPNKEYPETVVTYYVKGKGFFMDDDTTPHDVFRVNGYPENRLFNMEDTLNFCKTNSIELNNYQLQQLNDFWNKYPDGMIQFG